MILTTVFSTSSAKNEEKKRKEEEKHKEQEYKRQKDDKIRQQFCNYFIKKDYPVANNDEVSRFLIGH